MKKRALRRHQQWVAKLRHVHIIWNTSHTWPWVRTPLNSIEERRFWLPDQQRYWFVYRRKPWQQVSRCTMNGEPKRWQHDFNIRPSRATQSRLLRATRRASDPDLITEWPDYRRPHIYFW
jgi:hypothetical protein